LSWTPAYSATSYHIYRATGSTGPFSVIANSTSAACTDATVSDTTAYTYVVTAVNAGGETPASNQATATVLLPPLQQWRLLNFGTLNPADPGGGDTAVPAGCGVSNLMRYALGLPLAGTAPAGLPAVSQSNGYLTLSFTRLKADTDITYHVLASSDHSQWTELWNSSAVPYSGGTNPTLQVTVPDTVPISSAPSRRRFLQLEVTNP